MLNDRYVPFFFLGVLVFSFVGFSVLKNLFDKISQISEQISTKYTDEQMLPGTDELNTIVRSFSSIEKQFSQTFKQLERKSTEISILKELADLCYVTFDPEEILFITLERALALAGSDIGSILTLEKTEPKSFVVKATLGRGEFVKPGDRIDFETSIAKHAVINKSPLVVADIEKDKRFGRANHSQYGSKSFVCMPIKTSKEIIGVLTISSKNQSKVYTQEDVEIIAPLLSNAAFTYENLRLLKENQQGTLLLKSIEKIFKVFNSGIRDSELLQTVLTEIQSAVAFDLAAVMRKDDSRSGYLEIVDLLVNGPSYIVKGSCYSYSGSTIEKVINQESLFMTDDPALFRHSLDQELFVKHGCSSCLLVPLKSDGIVTGILALAAKEPAVFYGAQDFVQWIANGLSLSIERNRLCAAVAKRSQELDTIRQIGSVLASSTFDISKVLKYTMDMIREVMNVEAGSLLFLEDSELKIAVSFNIKMDAKENFRLKMGQGIAGYVAARGEAIIVNDTEKSPHFFPVIDEFSGFKTRSALCVPMVSQGKVIGVIEVLNKTGGDFSPDDKDLLQSIASSVCIAIENARLYKETVSMAKHERDMRRMFQKFVPEEILDRIIHGSETGKPVVEELRTITLLNIDIRGFSALAKQIGSQKTVSLLNHYFSMMGDIVFKHQGIVDKYLGDGFLALFGAPVSSTIDADNAIAAANEMKASLDPLNRQLQKKFGASVTIGISVHTGEVVVGNIGFEKKMDYTVIGDAVNTVFRLQNLTKTYANGILLSEYTLRAARSRPEVVEIPIPDEKQKEIGDLKVFQLLEPQENVNARITLNTSTAINA